MSDKMISDKQKEKLDLEPPRELEVFRKDPRAKLPWRANESAVGWDVFACMFTESSRPSKRMISRTQTVAIPTGLILRPPAGYFLQVCSRSGLASRGVFVANAPGIIDPDYTGELMILLFNGGYEPHWIEHEHRIAQVVVSKINETSLREIPAAPISLGRGDAGFGSTGA